MTDLALLAVEDAYCRVLAARNPGTSWVPAHRAQNPGTALTGHVTARLVPDEADTAAIPDGGVRVARAA